MSEMKDYDEIDSIKVGYYALLACIFNWKLDGDAAMRLMGIHPGWDRKYDRVINRKEE